VLNRLPGKSTGGSGRQQCQPPPHADKEGKPYTVRYDQVNAMLLNEFLKEYRKVENLKNDSRATVAQQQKEIAALTAIVKEQAAQIQKVSAQLEASKPARKWSTIPKAGWSWGISAIDSNGRTIWIGDAHRGDGKRFVVRADEKLTAFVELEVLIRVGGELP
jgi:hypothetical protein